MSGTGAKPKQGKPETVRVVVVVNHDDLRRGESGEVELTDVVRGRLDSGYLRLADYDETDAEVAGVPGPALGQTARVGREPRTVLLGVDSVPGSVPVGTGGETAAG